MRVFTLKEVEQHARADDMWLIIDGTVYDVSHWAASHPGGPEVLETCAGTDATADFHDIFHSDNAKKILTNNQFATFEGKWQLPWRVDSCPFVAAPIRGCPSVSIPASSPLPAVLARCVPMSSPPVAQPAFSPPKELPGPCLVQPIPARLAPPQIIHLAQPAQNEALPQDEFKQSINSLADVIMRLLVPVIDGVTTPAGDTILESIATLKARMLVQFGGDVDACLAQIARDSVNNLANAKLLAGVMYTVPFVGLLGWATIPVFMQLREAALIAALKGHDLSQETVKTNLVYTVAVQITHAIPKSAFTRAGTAIAAQVLARAIANRTGALLATGVVRGFLPVIYDFITNGEAYAQRLVQWDMIVSTIRQSSAPPPVPSYQFA